MTSASHGARVYLMLSLCFGVFVLKHWRVCRGLQHIYPQGLIKPSYLTTTHQLAVLSVHKAV